MPSEPLIHLIRHGPTDWSAAKKLQGRTDRPLSKQGVETVKTWRDTAPAAEGVLSSPLQRAQETARILYPDRQISTDFRLIEMDFGEWEGSSIAELRDRFGASFRDQEARGLDMQPPNGESPRKVQHRLQPLFAELCLRGETITVIAHKGVIRVCYAWAVGWDMTQDPPQKLKDGCFHSFKPAANGALALVALNQSMVAPTQSEFPKNARV